MLFNKEEERLIIQAIQEAELRTSGEIRLFVESNCPEGRPVERAAELLYQFGMHKTKERNGVLIYIADKSHHFAIWGDSGIHEKVGLQFWEAEKDMLLDHLRRGTAGEGVCLVVRQVGEKLSAYFPADRDDNENELSDEIIYG